MCNNHPKKEKSNQLVYDQQLTGLEHQNTYINYWKIRENHQNSAK